VKVVHRVLGGAARPHFSIAPRQIGESLTARWVFEAA